MSMFVDRLLDALGRPAGSASDELLVDTGRYRVLLMRELRGRQALDAARREALAAWVRDGGLDDFLHGLADNLIELGAAHDQGALDHFLQAAVLEKLGAASPLGPTDRLLLELAGGPAAPESELSVRLLARRYAWHLGLVTGVDAEGRRGCTALGATVLKLPVELVLPCLVVLEGLSSYGAGDPWRAPAPAYEQLRSRRELRFLMGADQRRQQDPEGLWPLHRLRRWVYMGLCAPLRPEERGAGCAYAVRLTEAGQRALAEALRQPPSEVAVLTARLFQAARRKALSGLLPRPEAPPAAASAAVLSLPPQPARAGVVTAPAKRSVLLAAQAREAAPAQGAAAPAPPGDPFDLGTLCRGLVQEVLASPRFSHVNVEVKVAEGTPRARLALVHGRRRLRLLIGDLLGTACAAVADLSLPRVQLELSAPGGELVLHLHDNGPGIPVSQRPHIFGESGGAPAGGSGPRYRLGAVRQVLEEGFGGRIEMAAPRLGGVSFRLVLPRRLAEAAA